MINLRNYFFQLFQSDRFKTGDKPSQQTMQDLVDSTVNRLEDAAKIDMPGIAAPAIVPEASDYMTWNGRNYPKFVLPSQLTEVEIPEVSITSKTPILSATEPTNNNFELEILAPTSAFYNESYLSYSNGTGIFWRLPIQYEDWTYQTNFDAYALSGGGQSTPIVSGGQSSSLRARRIKINVTDLASTIKEVVMEGKLYLGLSGNATGVFYQMNLDFATTLPASNFQTVAVATLPDKIVPVLVTLTPGGVLSFSYVSGSIPAIPNGDTITVPFQLRYFPD